MTNKSPYIKQHAPHKDSNLVPSIIKQAMANQLRRQVLLEEAGLDENKQFKTEFEQLAYTARIESVLKG